MICRIKLFFKSVFLLYVAVMILSTQLLAWGRGKKDYSEIKHRDYIRDARTHPQALQKTIIVRRYTQRKKDLLRDIKPGEHFTSPIKSGRLPGAYTAQRRLGLEKKPNWVANVRLDKGQMVKKNKAMGGLSGYGEITSTKRTPKSNVFNIRKSN